MSGAQPLQAHETPPLGGASQSRSSQLFALQVRLSLRLTLSVN